MKITVELLKKLGACEEGIEEFSHFFPKGAAVTKQNLDKIKRSRSNKIWYLKGEGKRFLLERLTGYRLKKSARKLLHDKWEKEKQKNPYIMCGDINWCATCWYGLKSEKEIVQMIKWALKNQKVR